jgi:predicted RNA-binding protein with RPS1 domain
MMIDEDQTPTGDERARTPAEEAGQAPDATEGAGTPPSAVSTTAPAAAGDELAVPEDAASSEAPAYGREPQSDDRPNLPGTEPEPNMPPAPGDPVPSPETPQPAPPPPPETPQPPQPEPAPSPVQPQGEQVDGASAQGGAAQGEQPPQEQVQSDRNGGQASAEQTPTGTAEPAPEVRDERADAELFESYMNRLDGEETEAADLGYKRLSKGDRIEATIIQVDRDKVFVDLGTKTEGYVPLSELSEDNLESATDHFSVGDKINVVVIRPEGEGGPLVSKKRADFEEAWDRIEDAYQTQEMITAQVVDRVKGGLVVDVGVRGFVPATHVGSGKLRNIEKFVGQPLQLKVIEIDRDRKKVVLSNREAEEQRRKSAKEEIFTNVKPGDVLEGTVRRLADYGAFVDLGGVDGLLHISEMSWARINHPKEMFQEGQKIKVMVLRLDPDAGKISLGHRQVLPDPWNLIRENYTPNQRLTVTIGRIVQSGAFVKLPEGAEAFLPVSEMSFRRVKRPQDVVEENQEVEVQIIDLRPDERRMVLSMRAIGGGGEVRIGGGGGERDRAPSYDDDMRGKPGGKKKGKKGGRGRDFEDDFEESIGRRGFATGGATIGERLGMLKGFLSRDEDEEVATSGDAEAEAEAEAEAPAEAGAGAPERTPDEE